MADDRITFAARVDDLGRIAPDQVAQTKGRLQRWKGRHVTVAVTRYVKQKTLPQLGYYFGVVIPTWAEYAGYNSEEELHRDLKREFFPKRRFLSKLTGEEGEEVPSLKDASSEEMGEYLTRVLREADSQGLRLPRPNEVLEDAI